MIIGRKVIVKDEVASTNDLMKSLANEGEEEGLVVTAKVQVAGRGRMGRTWSSPEGGVYLSVLLRPKVPVHDMLRMTVLACVPVAQTIEEASGCRATVKWPNDVEINGQKVAGLLVESLSKGSEIAYLVLGIGINLNVEPESLGVPGATSVSACAGKVFDREAFLNILLYRLDTFYASFLKGTFEASEYTRRSSTIGSEIEVESDGTTIVGKATGVDATGALVLVSEDGSEHRLSSVQATTIRKSNR
ncbi:MAG TPA: biotin--[acetyl-CoA-carboxylase] ligase [Methanomassiliicoccales archaeon]|jgi:BirA family biotin operon repressor/biotin-[acetyl-CoA-carboxylase] ligase